MQVIVGLGNPGFKYSKTRHNAGFDTIDILASSNNIKIKKRQLSALTGQGIIAGKKVLLVKPQTYMNSSGEAVKAIMDYYDIRDCELLVISDDLTLDIGVLRIRTRGSDGGHNGLKSIISEIGTKDFARLRIGIGKVPSGEEVIRHVLGRFDRADRDKVKSSYNIAATAIEYILEEGIERAMSKYNGNVLMSEQ